MTEDQLLRAYGVDPRSVGDILERAALEGRPDPDPSVSSDHDPVPPTLRCQRCGRRLVLDSIIWSTATTDYGRTPDHRACSDVWRHDPDDDGR